MAYVDLKEIESELRDFGETVDRKRLSKNPEVYIKKLNHLRVRKQQGSPGRTGRLVETSRVDDNEDNYDESDDDDEEEEEERPRQTRQGVVVQRSVTERKTRRQTIHELPSPSRTSPSRRAGVPVPAGPILHRKEYDDQPKTRRRSTLNTPVVMDTDLDLENTREYKGKGKWSSSGLGVPIPAGPIPGRSSETSKTESSSSSKAQASGRSVFGVSLPFSRYKAESKSDGKELNKTLPSHSTPTRNRLSDFSDDEADFMGRDVGINTSSKWQDSSVSADLNNTRSRIGLSSQIRDKPVDTAYNRGFTTSDYSHSNTVYDRSSGYGSTSSRVSSVLNEDWRNKADEGRQYSSQWSSRGSANTGSAKKWFNGKSVQSFCSYVVKYLCVIPVLIFAVIIALYINLKLTPSIDTASCNLMPCIEGSSDTNCLTAVEVQEVKAALPKLLDVLSRRAGDYDCAYTAQPRHLTLDEALTVLLWANYSISNTRKLLAVIQLNPDFQIKLLDDDGKTLVKDPASAKCLESERVTMGVICRVRLTVERFFYRLCLLIIGIATVLLLILAVRLYRKRKASKLKELHVLVEDIIGMLKNHAATYKESRGTADIPPYIPVPHVRDALIPLKDRKKKQALWNKAVKFLSANESRVREEIHMIEGEETLCWKWLETFSNTLMTTGREQTRSSLTGLSTKPYSSCLKISNLINGDCSDEKLAEIRDLVLERCGTYHGILHLAVDSAIKDCVYIKCVSEKAAGQNYKFLHGWWYEGRVISVQYVGDSLYKSIFPDSANHFVPLRLSKAPRPNYNNTSLSTGSLPTRG